MPIAPQKATKTILPDAPIVQLTLPPVFVNHPIAMPPFASPMLPPETLALIREGLAGWYKKEARDYPWRRTRDPYAILVSELMLQQTQIATVIGRGYFRRWMDQFPDWESLAAASEVSVLKNWEGLGYYNRARNLQRAARSVIGDHGGHFPRDAERARSLPGVGPYTAGAVLSLAYGLPEPVVDGNVARVLSRLFLIEEAIDSSVGLKRLWAIARELVSPEDPAIHNSALMELGQRLCRPSNPDCQECPLQIHCLASRVGRAESLPNKKKPTPVQEREECVLIARRSGQIYLVPESGNRRKGLWRLPEVSAESSSDLTESTRFVYPITRYRVLLRVFEAPAGWTPPAGTETGGWFLESGAEALPPLGAPYLRAIERSRSARDSLEMRP